jgi:prolyl-tRNA editing enzyme YbaK/EbsC (Cys-tRNA(Pro) deacylase)
VSTEAQRMQEWLRRNAVQAQLTRFDQRVHSVEEAVRVSGHPVERFTKSIVMLSSDGRVIVAVVPATHRASTERVRKALALEQRPRIATPEESEALLGQRVGGNSPLNAGAATVLVDPFVLEQEWFVTGGGDDRCLVTITTEELRRAVSFREVRVRK